MLNSREVIERVTVGGDESSAGRAGGGRDLQVVRSAWSTGPSRVGEQARVVSGDVEIEGDDVEGREDRVDGGFSGRTAPIVGQFDTDEQL